MTSMLKDRKGQAAIAGIAIAAVIFIIVLQVFGEFLSVTTNIMQPNANVFLSTGFNQGVMDLIDLLPLVIVGAALVSIVVVAFRLSV